MLKGLKIGLGPAGIPVWPPSGNQGLGKSQPLGRPQFPHP